MSIPAVKTFMVVSFLRVLRVGIGVSLLLVCPAFAQEKLSGKESGGSIISGSAPIAATATTGASTQILSSTPSHSDEVFAAMQKKWRQDTSGEPAAGEDPNVSALTETNDNSLIHSMGQMMISLAFVILLGLSVAWIFKRFFGKNSVLGGGRIEWLGSYSLSQKSKVHLLRVGKQSFLVGEGTNSVTLISQVDPDNEPVPISNDAGIEEPLPKRATLAESSFQNQLSQWQNTVDNRNIRQEVNASLLFLKGLTQRLRNKGGQNA